MGYVYLNYWICFFITFSKTNQGMVIGLIFIIISFMAITSIAMPDWFSWFDFVFVQLEKFLANPAHSNRKHFII
ncbi:hypothetical protein [Piscibacillus salipiscarius]|uniref:hypothetical protein n=1 Tax=Piscibacillus salipiscarius TaxID=299480 RepID=UPI002436BD2C|nr:hypothetical protein [Piscibacillus salipiscarius]